MLYKLVNFQNLQEGELILGYGVHALCRDRIIGDPDWGIIEDEETIIVKALRAEVDVLKLRIAELVQENIMLQWVAGEPYQESEG